MKKLLTVFVSLLMLFAVAGCGKSENKPSGGEPLLPPDETNPGTTPVVLAENMGDAMAGENIGYEYTDTYIKIFTKDHVFEADMTKEVYEKMEEVDFFSEDKEVKYAEILKDLPVKNVIVKADRKLSKEEMDNYAGKSGQELVDDGASCYGTYFGEDKSEFFIELEYNNYVVEVNEDYAGNESFDMIELLGQSTIKHMDYDVNN